MVTSVIEIAGWIAPTATMIAAMMTAANLGARVTGSGFVVFVIGSICWSAIGLSTGQTNLVASNVFLTLVNLVGIWRWLGRQRAYEDGGKAAELKSRRSSASNLFAASGIAGKVVQDVDAEPVGKAVETLIECRTGRISYVVVATGGIGGVAEVLRAVPNDAIAYEGDHLKLDMSRERFEALTPLEPGDWPAAAPVVSAAAA